MPLPVVPDHFYVAATFQRSDGDPVVNTYTFRNDGGSVSQDTVADNVRDLLDAFYGSGSTGGTNVGGYLSDRLFGLTYVIYDLGTPDAGGLERASATWRTAAGTGGSLMPPDCAVTISWQTARRGRSYRGRTYLGPVKQTALDGNGYINSTARATFATAASLLIGEVLTRTLSIAVLSRTLQIATPVTGGYIDSEFDTQRRRGHVGASRTPITPP